MGGRGAKLYRKVIPAQEYFMLESGVRQSAAKEGGCVSQKGEQHEQK
jgi:hypothetical protein